MPTIFDGPLFSVILCVMAAIALRYALFYGRETVRERESERDPEREAGRRERELAYEERIRALQDSIEREQVESGNLRNQLVAAQAEVDAHRHAMRTQDQDGDGMRGSAESLTAEREHLLCEVRQLRRQIEEQHRTNDLIQDELVQERARGSQLIEQLAASNGTIAHLREEGQVVGRLRQTLEHANALRQEADDRREELESRLRQEQAHREELETRRASAEREIGELTAEVRKAEALGVRIATLEGALGEKERELAQAFESSTALRSAADEEAMKLAVETRLTHDLRAELERLREQFGQQGRGIQLLTHERDQLRARLEASELNTQQLREALQITETRQHAALRDRTEMEQAASRLRDDLARHTADFQALEQSHAAAQAELRRVTRELAGTTQREESSQGEIAELRKQTQRLQDELERVQGNAESLVNSRNQLQSQAEQRLADVESLRQALELSTTRQKQLVEQLHAVATEKEEIVLGLQREKGHRARLEEELTETRTTLAEHDALARENEQAHRRLEEKEHELRQLEARIARQEMLLREVRVEKEDALSNLEVERSERRSLERRFALQAESLQQLRTDARNLESLLEKQTALHTSLHEHAERLHASAFDSPSGPAISIRESRLSQEPLRVFAAGTTAASGAPSEPAPSVRESNRGRLPSQPIRRDDLRRISGIGEIVEQRLNELGVYTFAQIAEWDAAQVAEFSRRLSFRDRIEREQWVAQAQRLCQEQRRMAA